MQFLSQRHNGFPTFDNLLALDDGFQWIITSYIMHIATSDHGNVSPLCLRGVCQHGPRRTASTASLQHHGLPTASRDTRSVIQTAYYMLSIFTDIQIDTNVRNCREVRPFQDVLRCLRGLRIITKSDSQAPGARHSSVSIASPLGMAPSSDWLVEDT